MEFNVSSLLKEHTGATRAYDIDDDLAIDGAVHHVAGHVRFDRTPDGVLVRAHLRGTAHGECSRCLKPAAYGVDIEFEEQYIPTVDVHTGVQLAPPAGEEDAFRIDARHILDLREAARQYWALALPIAPVCREDCPGLCPLCGEDLTPGHPCAGDQTDARWSKLADLRLG